jgi:hypothetical protein
MKVPLSNFTTGLLTLFASAVVSHGALTTTLLGTGVPSPSTATGDTVNATNAVTLRDGTGTPGDFWEQGDQGIFLHNSTRTIGSFSAVARIIGQTEAANGSWGKTGIMARNDLTTTSAFAMSQAAAGNATQPTGANPVPIRLAGRQLQGVTGAGTMFEDTIGAANSNNVFRTDGGVNTTWLRLDYTAATNTFVAGFAPDVGGNPGAWTLSAPRTNVPDSNPADGWWVGLAYSAHEDMSLGNPATEGLHGVTFDRFSIIPEPSTALLASIVVGALALRRRRR